MAGMAALIINRYAGAWYRDQLDSSGVYKTVITLAYRSFFNLKS
jgi:hypothetical protein